ncbi:MAG TPA: DUF2336 domain-containing protein [Acidobacteriota bacterium]|nr:DUF2336 domain-containing protein [Acidobacteriota bacterium]
MLTYNLISDLENAVATRSAETGTMLRRVTDLFLINAGHYTADQLELYDGILQVLIAAVEVSARAELAQRLAPIDGVPANTIRTLALDDAIEVAEPVLAQSNALGDDVLTHCITIKGQEHLLAIATRITLSETVTDQLVTRGSIKVLRTLASNPGAAISDLGFGILVKKSADDDWLSERVARRVDIPEYHLRDLISKASEIVRQRLMADIPELGEIIKEILPDSVPAANNTPDLPRDYRTAELVINSKPLNEAVVNEFAKAKKLEEIIVSISRLSGLPALEIERLFMGTWSSPVAVILKAIGFRLATVEAIYRSRLSNGEVIRDDLFQTKGEFIALRRPTAERIMRFYCARKAAKSSDLS